MAGLLHNGLALLRAPANELAFALRQWFRWQRGAPTVVPSRASCVGSDRFAWADDAQRAALLATAARLHADYQLEGLSQARESIYCSNLARLHTLERLAGDLEVPCGEDGRVRAVDLGAGDFHYAVALQQWLACRRGGSEPRPVVLRAIEVDGYGVYRDGHSRLDHARGWAQRASIGESLVRYELADATRVRLPEQDVVSLFFPFLTAYACLQWGAPLSRSRPRQLLRRAVATLRPGGWLVVANQTHDEHRRLCLLLEELPIRRVARCGLASDLVPDAERTHGQVGSIWVREADFPSAPRSG